MTGWTSDQSNWCWHVDDVTLNFGSLSALRTWSQSTELSFKLSGGLSKVLPKFQWVKSELLDRLVELTLFFIFYSHNFKM